MKTTTPPEPKVETIPAHIHNQLVDKYKRLRATVSDKDDQIALLTVEVKTLKAKMNEGRKKLANPNNARVEKVIVDGVAVERLVPDEGFEV
jgi:hypothetical protein